MILTERVVDFEKAVKGLFSYEEFLTRWKLATDALFFELNEMKDLDVKSQISIHQVALKTTLECKEALEQIKQARVKRRKIEDPEHARKRVLSSVFGLPDDE